MDERPHFMWKNELAPGPEDPPEVSLKETLALVARGLGGPPAMLKWARRSDDNERLFYTTLYPKLLPIEVAAEVDMGQLFTAVAAQWMSPE